MKKSYQVLKWTAEVREKELQCLEEVELLDNHDPAVEFESDSESEAYDFLEKESGLLHIHKFDSCGLKFAEVDCLLLQEVEVDEDGDIIDCEYLDMRYPKIEEADNSREEAESFIELFKPFYKNKTVMIQEANVFTSYIMNDYIIKEGEE